MDGECLLYSYSVVIEHTAHTAVRFTNKGELVYCQDAEAWFYRYYPTLRHNSSGRISQIS